VSLDLIKAQSARASWLLRAQARLAGYDADRASRSHVIGDVLTGVRDRLAAECRLNGVGLQVTCESRAAVTIDDTLLTVGVTSAVLSLAGLLTGLEGAVIRVDARCKSGRRRRRPAVHRSLPGRGGRPVLAETAFLRRRLGRTARRLAGRHRRVRPGRGRSTGQRRQACPSATAAAARFRFEFA
jgi:hypothetical protein